VVFWREMLSLNRIQNPSPQEDFETKEFKSSPRLWRGAGGEVFWRKMLSLNRIQNPSPQERRTLKLKNSKAPLACGEGLGVRFFGVKC
jgi:hypothetical protein